MYFLVLYVFFGVYIDKFGKFIRWLGRKYIMNRKKYNILVEVMFEVIGGKWKCVIFCYFMYGKKCISDFKCIMFVII